MAKKKSTEITKPISAWNKPLKVNFKDLFRSLTKAVGQAAILNWGQAINSASDAISAVGLETSTGQMAWLLIHRSIMRAMFTLVEENIDLIKSGKDGFWNLREQQEFSEEELETLCQKLDLSLEKQKLSLDEKFFLHPRELPVLEDMKKPFAQWLKGMGLNEAQAKAISDRISTYFVYALNEEWRTHRTDYACLIEDLNTPFTKANDREQGWSRYSAWLQKQIEEPMFYEAFSLKQVYIPLRAYYELKYAKEKHKQIEQSITEDKERKPVVIELEKELEAWLKQSDKDDAIRIISGGPGCGKSSFTKMFAAKLAGKSDRRILFVPLHRFEPADDLIDAIRDFVHYDSFLPHNPIDPKDGDSQLFIIFDGLDELSMQGKVASEVAQQFVQEVQRKIANLNAREPRLQVLISGRELSVQAHANNFRKPQQILHVLPYYISEAEQARYHDSRKILKQDLRHQWWKAYGLASGQEFDSLPEVLNRNELTEITSQPLLNYLMALSFVRGKIDFAKESNLNTIYQDLLNAVFERVWGDIQHPAISNMSEKEFFLILEEIALAAWHGAGRTTTVREIESQCESSGFKNLLEKFKENAKEGIARLLMAFYFRKSGNHITGDETFEFTHKSFGEYLTAKRIVRGVRLMHDELERRKETFGSGWGENEALGSWIKLCGKTAIDRNIYKFVKNEVRLHDLSLISKWQTTLCQLINFMLRHGTPMELLNPRPGFSEEVRQARNAEEALLAALSACANRTKVVSAIEYPSQTSLGEWLSRLQGQRSGGSNVIALNCLSYLDMSDCMLYIQDMYGITAHNSNLKHAWLSYTNFLHANLEGANLQDASLQGADFQHASLQDANLQSANLQGANLQEAALFGANLEDANLQGANLQGAGLQGANLQGADIQGAKFEDTQFEDVIWIDGRKIKGGSIENFIFEGDSEKQKRGNQ